LVRYFSEYSSFIHSIDEKIISLKILRFFNCTFDLIIIRKNITFTNPYCFCINYRLTQLRNSLHPRTCFCGDSFAAPKRRRLRIYGSSRTFFGFTFTLFYIFLINAGPTTNSTIPLKKRISYIRNYHCLKLTEDVRISFL
jgi:hypothetical protein